MKKKSQTSIAKHFYCKDTNIGGLVIVIVWTTFIQLSLTL